MPTALDKVGRFKTVRLVPGAFSVDADPLPTSLPDDQRFKSIGDYITFYWTGTTPGGTLNVTICFYDGQKGIWVVGATVSGLAPLQISQLKAFNYSHAAFRLFGSPTGTDVEVRAMSSNV